MLRLSLSKILALALLLLQQVRRHRKYLEWDWKPGSHHFNILCVQFHVRMPCLASILCVSMVRSELIRSLFQTLISRFNFTVLGQNYFWWILKKVTWVPSFMLQDEVPKFFQRNDLADSINLLLKTFIDISISCM